MHYWVLTVVTFASPPQSAWTRGFPGCRVWGSQAAPHIPAGRVSVGRHKKKDYVTCHSFGCPALTYPNEIPDSMSAWSERLLPPCFAAITSVSWHMGRQAVGRLTPWWDPSYWRSTQGRSRRHSRVLSPRLLLSSFGKTGNQFLFICFYDISSV